MLRPKQVVVPPTAIRTLRKQRAFQIKAQKWSCNQAHVLRCVQVAEQRGERLAVLAIPADLGVADFCAFLGGYLRAVSARKPECSRRATVSATELVSTWQSLAKTGIQNMDMWSLSDGRVIAGLCIWISITSKQVREMRLVRREDARGVCLVLLRFCDAETAAGFYDNYNGRPVRLRAPR